MQERKKKLKPKQDAKNQPAKGRVSTTEGFFLQFLPSFLQKSVPEPELENRHRLISVYRPLLAFPITLAPAEGLSCYLKEGLA